MTFSKNGRKRIPSRGYGHESRRNCSANVIKLDVQYKREILNSYTVIYEQEKKDIDHTVSYLDRLLVESQK